jgi:hypothetical protein
VSLEVHVTRGVPSAEEAAALTAAVQALLEVGAGHAEPQLPWPYRSAWRRAAIDEGIDR